MDKRPNIIIFNPDQMRADSLAHLGNPASHTPFLDSLAQSEAVSFRHAFCQNPVCVPSRCSFLSGLFIKPTPNIWFCRDMQVIPQHIDIISRIYNDCNSFAEIIVITFSDIQLFRQTNCLSFSA